jgi:hypothetical protein
MTHNKENWHYFYTTNPLSPNKDNIMKIFAVAIIKNPSQKEKEEGQEPKVLMEPCLVLAKSRELLSLKVQKITDVDLTESNVELIVKEL